MREAHSGTSAVEPVPSQAQIVAPVDELAADGVAEMLFVRLPLKFMGPTGSWVRPVATT